MSCLLCSLNLDGYETVNIKLKGIQTLIKCSIDRKDNLADSLRNLESITVHNACRKSYTHRKYNGKLMKFHGPEPPKPDNDEFEFIPILSKNQSSSNAKKHPDTSGSGSATEKSSPKNVTETVSADKKTASLKIGSYNTKDNVLMESDSTAETAVYLPESVENGTEIKHFPCGEEFSSKLPIPQTSIDTAGVSTSYQEPRIDCKTQTLSDEDDPTKPFPFQHNCLFCAKEINQEAELKKPCQKRNNAYCVSRDKTKETLLKYLKKTPSPMNMKILERIQDVDLVHVKAQYHINCYRDLLLQKKCRKKEGEERRRKGQGRPECPFIKAAVEKISRYIDASDRTEFTTTELINAGTSDDYQPQWRTLAGKIEKKYEGKVYFTPVSGRSSIVTIIKGSKTGGSAFIQPWNLNSTELGEQTQDLLKNKRKYYKTNKELAEKDKRKHVTNKEKELVRDDIKIKENKCDTENENETITEYNDNDNDFIDDTFNSEEYATENKSNILICQICLSWDRRLEDLGNYRDILRKIGSDFFIHDFEPKLFLVCWECIALLKNVKRFQKKIVIAQKLWNTEVHEPLQCLSTLSITTPSNASVSCTDEKQNAKNSQEYLEPEIVAVYSLPQEDMPLIEDQKPAVEEINMDYDTFGNDTKDFEEHTKDMDNDTFDYETKDMDDEDGDGSEYQEKIRPKLKRRKAQVKRKKCVDEGRDLDVSSKSTRRPRTQKPSSEDPDWEATTVKQKAPKEKKNKVKLKIPYTMIVQSYITETKIKREPIEPHELQYWLDTERNSDYFKTLKHKCIKCISEVPENHDALCHSKGNPFVCDICESTFPRKDEKESHVANHYYIFSCEFCRYKCYNEAHMRCHVESHRRLVQCLECFAAFETFDVLKEHFNNLHRYAECDYCGKQFAHKRTVITHLERHHTPQICTICNTSYSSYSHKMHHMNLKHRIERTEAAYCVQCDIQFDNVAQLKRHVYHNIRHKHEWKREPPKKVKEQHKCPECPNVYAQKHTMKCHYNLVHAKKITFYCNYCDKPFATKNNYKNHMRARHEGYEFPKNKFCHICGRGFTTNRILVNHIRTHTGERPFACPHCASSFAQKAALRSHIAHVHEKRQRTSAGDACTKRRQSNAQPSSFIDSSLGLI